MSFGRRLLFLLPFAPRLDATHGGGRIMAQFLSEMASRHEVGIVYLRSTDEPPADVFFHDRCAFVEGFLRPSAGKSLPQRWLRCARLVGSLLRLQPMWVTDWASTSYANRVRSIAQAFQPDIVQIEYHVMGQYLPVLDKCEAPRVLTEHEPGVRAAPYIKRSIPIASGLINSLEKLAWQRYESAVVRRVRAVIVFTESDQRMLELYAGETPVYNIPPGTMIPDQPFDPLGYSPPSLLFIGSFIHPPNIDAATRLIRQIFPSVQRHFPEMMLFIVGEQPPPELRQMASENIVITGRVPDIAPFVNRATLFVAPLHTGGGIRVKVLEALAAGKAVVATPLAVEGMLLTDGEQVSLAETDEEFAERIIQLLRDPETRASIATRARAWACDHLGWDQSIDAHEMLYAKLLERRIQTRTSRQELRAQSLVGD